MARKTARRSPRPVTHAAFTRLQRDLERCTEKVQHLENEIGTTVRRMGAMQAEIDHLRALTKR